MKKRLVISKTPIKMFAIYRRCNTFPEWCLHCIVPDDTMAKFYMRYKDIKPDIVKFIRLERKMVSVNCKLSRSMRR